MYRAIIRRDRTTTLSAEKEKLLHILSIFVALGMQFATRMRHIAICSLPRSTIFCHFIS
jgi:hypothetical protein